MHLVSRLDTPCLNFSQDNQVANELDLVGGEVNRTRNVGREPKLPGDYSTVSGLYLSPYTVGFSFPQISFGKLRQGFSSGHYEDQYSQFWTRLLCSLYFPRGMASRILTM
jgi:hypothetical protein